MLPTMKSKGTWLGGCQLASLLWNVMMVGVFSPVETTSSQEVGREA